LDRELRNLEGSILTLGSEVERNIIIAVDILARRDMIGSKRLIAADRDINRKRIAIMNDGLTLIATQQPMASDMRRIASAIEITGEVERINDYVKGIARNSLMISAGPLPHALDGLPEMAEKTRDMLHRALDAFSRSDAELAKSIPLEDDVVDDLFIQTYRRLLKRAIERPDSLEQINFLEWIAHNLERAADRVTNICEWIVYKVEGVYVEMDSEHGALPTFKE
ncbi:MAG: phosphate signaling complex protein PhoU, partial [Candidatus Promineifilaceae bacterium]